MPEKALPSLLSLENSLRLLVLRLLSVKVLVPLLVLRLLLWSDHSLLDKVSLVSRIAAVESATPGKRT